VHGRSDLLGAVAVGVGDYFHQVTVGVVKIDAATTVQMIDFAGPCAPRMGVVPDALSADSGERRVEFRSAGENGQNRLARSEEHVFNLRGGRMNKSGN